MYTRACSNSTSQPLGKFMFRHYLLSQICFWGSQRLLQEEAKLAFWRFWITYNLIIAMRFPTQQAS
uniref:Putative ovule protein n=1 Tax=Solanum chacoense TaxID=4108 RepID=A0A0V0H0P8_SOLCH